MVPVGELFLVNQIVAEGVDIIKNKTIIIISVAVIVLAVFFISFSLATSGLFRTYYVPPGAVTTEIKLNDLGSAGRLEGNVALVYIFADDKNSSWDFNADKDRQTRERMFAYTDIATEWLCRQAKNYNKELSFSYASDENSDLYFEGRIDDVCVNNDKAKKKYAPAEWEYIDKNIDSGAIKEKYGCDSIVYFLYLNYTEENKTTPFTLSFYNRELDYPYEICFMPVVTKNTSPAPSTIAHEMLHTFGAPDLYADDCFDTNYGTDVKYVQYCSENHPQDLMYSTYIKVEGKKVKVFDRIEQELTDITAYYLGWIDEPPAEVDEFGLVHNQYENYTGK